MKVGYGKNIFIPITFVVSSVTNLRKVNHFQKYKISKAFLYNILNSIMNSRIGLSKSVTTSTLREEAIRSPSEILPRKMGNDKKIYSVMFEVFGRVQGVYFRKHTQSMAKELGLNGWCMNTKNGTVKGVIEGPHDIISEMKLWLQHQGSPRSKVEKAVFTPLEPIAAYNFNVFSIKR